MSRLPEAAWHALVWALPHMSEAWRRGLEWSDWLLAGVWCVRTSTLIRRWPGVPDLSEVQWDLCPVQAPGLAVVVPMRDEAGVLGPAMATLMAQDYPWLRVIAVDDRSTDGTGVMLDALAERHNARFGAVHLTEEAEGWIAKSFAMEVGASRSRSEWLLFTEADIWFSPSVLRRALSYAEMSGADHLVIAPSVIAKGWRQKVLSGFFAVLGLWFVRPWRVADRWARWDAVGNGAFNLIRREAWEELGGFAPQRLSIAADLTLGQRARAANLRQRLAFAPGLVLKPEASGTEGLGRQLWGLINLRLWMAAVFSAFVLLTFVVPIAGLTWWRTLVPSLLIVMCLAVHYQSVNELTGIEARWGWLHPVGALLLLWAVLRAVVTTLWHGGVWWKGTLYPLQALRRWNSPFVWEAEAAKRRAKEQKAKQGARRTWLRQQR